MFLGHNVHEGVRDPEHDEAGADLGVIADLTPFYSPVLCFYRRVKIVIKALEMLGNVVRRCSDRVLPDDLFPEANYLLSRLRRDTK